MSYRVGFTKSLYGTLTFDGEVSEEELDTLDLIAYNYVDDRTKDGPFEIVHEGRKYTGNFKIQYNYGNWDFDERGSKWS
jgi:hypothetical protein